MYVMYAKLCILGRKCIEIFINLFSNLIFKSLMGIEIFYFCKVQHREIEQIGGIKISSRKFPPKHRKIESDHKISTLILTLTFYV